MFRTSGTWMNMGTTSSTGRWPSTISPNCFSNQRPNKKLGAKNPDRNHSSDSYMDKLKQILVVFAGGLMVLNTLAAEAPDRPLHVLYLGAVNAGRGGGGGGFGGARTNYVYLPGQTLAPEAIYFDYVAVT